MRNTLLAALCAAIFLISPAFADGDDPETLRGYVRSLHEQRNAALSEAADAKVDLAEMQGQLMKLRKWLAEWCGDAPGCATPAAAEK